MAANNPAVRVLVSNWRRAVEGKIAAQIEIILDFLDSGGNLEDNPVYQEIA